ncbi:MAG: acyl-CoA thioesterase [Halieaceae bacterium]
MLSIEKDYPVIVSQDVIWGDLDAFGHVNNTVYLRYFEDVRMAYFEKLGMLALKEKAQLGPILANVACDFKLPIGYPDKIHIGGRAHVTGPKKIVMEFAVFSEHFDAIAASGSGLVVYFDYGEAQSCEIPSQIASAVETLLTKI